MPRRRIPIIAGIPHHVTQRVAHREFLLEGKPVKAMLASLLAHWAARESVLVHAFAIMDNHIHLSATETIAGGLRRMIGYATQALSEWMNEQRGARGPNWEKRFFASPMDDAHALLAAAYIERNPVAAGLVDDACDWRWSSAAFHCGRGPRPRLLTAPEGVPGGLDPREWARMLRRPTDALHADALHAASRSNRILGDRAWIERLEATLGRKLLARPRGRPRSRKM
jgi:putative transposase